MTTRMVRGLWAALLILPLLVTTARAIAEERLCMLVVDSAEWKRRVEESVADAKSRGISAESLLVEGKGWSIEKIDQYLTAIAAKTPVILAMHYSTFAAKTEALESEAFGRFLEIFDQRTERKTKYVVYSRAFLSVQRLSQETGIPVDALDRRLRLVNIKFSKDRISDLLVKEVDGWTKDCGGAQ